ncbi:LTA synthase family protein [Marinomonas flavescens]|uniref:LTA synthase family protein n=1 Tax=Marinomonas flavescens TaxID=2529379 RepID=UPI00105625BC|nr:alkaline phosphatase family protein [Marinomonas flavescens]
MYQTRIRSLFATLVFQIVYIVLILMVSRYAMLASFSEPSQLASHSDDVQRMWTTGIRYDLRVAGMLMVPFALLGLLMASSQKTWKVMRVCLPWVFGLLAFIVAMVAISDYYYYQTYHNTFDVFAFGLAEDDTTSVLANMWEGYPIIRGLLSALVLAFVAVRLVKFFIKEKTPHKWNVGFFVLYVLIFIIVLAIISRGSLGTFPLRRGNAQVSQLLLLNKITPNGFMSLSWAIDDHNEDLSFSPVTKAKGKQLEKALGISSIMEKTPKNPWLAENKPNVVMALMESFGSNMLQFDEVGKNDLLGHLRPHFAEDFVFKRFISEDNGTAPSLAAMFFHSPMQNISHSSAQHTKLSGTPFDVYKKAGYKVIFISPGNMMWRNLVNYLPVQGVDAVYDQNTLMKMYPESANEITDWGVPDDYAYRLAEKLLKESKGPIFISILTITNHPPYVTPSRYHPQPIAITPEVKRHAEAQGQEELNIQETYQFATDAFGQFINAVEASNKADSTLIAATGDHQMRRLKAYYPEEQMLDRAVPFYLHIPKKILDHTSWRYDQNRVGSHKDIFPTLYNFSLSDTSYQAIAGRNMLAVEDDRSRAFGYNTTLWIDNKGAYPMSGKPAFYPWKNDSGLEVKKQSQDVAPFQQARQKALPALLRWQINAHIKGFKD